MSDMAPAPHTGPNMRGHGGEASWMIGVILILLGVAFMLEQAGVIAMTGNWWAVFIYLAAAASFLNVWRSYRARGEFGPAAGGSLVWGLALTMVASIFAFNLSWDMWWPSILIAVGVGIVASYLFQGATRKPGGGEG